MEADSTEDIESLMEDMDYIPGHFHLDLNLNCDPVGPVKLRHRDTYLKQESLHSELEAEVGYLQYAVRNLLGLLAFHLDQLDTAEEIFRSICKEDPGNLNAWANLGYVYDKLGRELDAGECVEKVSHLMGLDAGEASQEETRLLAARCLAEQAYVYPYDVELESEDDLRERLTAALTLYNKALDYGGQLINMILYARDLEKAKHGDGGIPDRQKLTEARKDLDKVLTVRPCLRTHLEMAQVYYYMGVDALQESLLVDEGAVNSALVSLSQAIQFELGDTLPDLHVLKGRCLLLKGEEQNAADCFKCAVELERPGSTDTTALRCLLQALLALFVQGGPDPNPAITQLELWVKKAEERYPEDIVKAELRCLYRTHTAEVTELSRALIRTGRLDLVKRLLQTVAPKQTAKKRTRVMSIPFT
eukprot:superscaffoldBa00000256_g3248